ncbi:AzlD domain-containing protein, partial [Candidatus Pelagibacter sp.]|nr:AzlD domain-containing protein [Candidatus Pelagibacter sp.]
MEINIVLAILATSVATYISRFFGVITSKKIKETSKIFKWFNCLAYSTLSALLARIIIFPAGALAEVDYFI